ncbi:MAG: RsmE family RNA methyltransferase, partial [Candidatus Pacebacteria bacterium]|nr:RsmE family RNA methyltransferase [Candidatus Paceibacterota bacterium]
AMITEIGTGFVKAEILKKMKNKSESKKETILYCAILKKENFEGAAQKATEAGIKKIIPIITDKTVKLNLNMERIGKIVKEAAEQSGRGIVPEISEPVDFDAALESAKQNDLNLFFTGNAPMIELKKIKVGQVGIFIGPEGGWSEREEKAAKKNKFQSAGLGKLTLRSETAATVASFICSQM